jgi:hypothetical protein
MTRLLPNTGWRRAGAGAQRGAAGWGWAPEVVCADVDRGLGRTQLSAEDRLNHPTDGFRGTDVHPREDRRSCSGAGHTRHIVITPAPRRGPPRMSHHRSEPYMQLHYCAAGGMIGKAQPARTISARVPKAGRWVGRAHRQHHTAHAAALVLPTHPVTQPKFF